MASKTIKGLTVEIGGDTTKLGKALEDVNKKSVALSGELRDVNKLLKFDPDNAELLAQKQKILAESITNTKSKLDTLKEAERQVQQQFERGEVSEAQVRALQREVIETTNRLQKEEKQAAETAAKIDKLGKSSDGAADDTQEVGDEAKKTDKKLDDLADSADKAGKAGEGMGSKFASAAKGGLAAVTAAVGAALGGMVGAAEGSREYRTEMGKLDTAFTTSGHTSEAATETYKTLQGVLGETDQAVEAANHLAKLAENEEELAEWTTIATGVYATFGDSLPIENLTEAANETAKTGAITGGLADALNWAGVSEEQFQASLDACTTEQERQALITSTLNGLYTEAAEKYRETNAEVIRANEANEAWAASMAEVGAAVDPILTDIKLMGSALLTDFLPGITQATTAFRGLLNGDEGAADAIGEALSGIITQLLDKIVTIAPTVVQAAMSLITTLTTTLISMLPQLVTVGVDIIMNIINGLTTAIPLITQAVVGMIPQLVQAIVTGIPQLIQGAVSLFLAILQAIPQIIPPLVAAIPQIVMSIIDGLVTAIPQLIQGALQFLLAIVQAIPLLLNQLVPQIPIIITAIIDGLIANIPVLLDAALTLLQAIVDAIPLIIQAIVPQLPSIINAIIDGLVDAVPLILDAAFTLLFAIIDAIPMIVGELLKALPSILSTIVNVLKSLPAKLWTILSQAISKFVEFTGKLLAKAKDGAIKVVNAIIDWMKQLPGKMWTAIKDGINKVVTWGKDLAAKGKAAAKSLFDSVVNGIKGLPNNIKSIGSDLVRGLWNGINDMVGWVKGKIKGFSNNVLDGIKSFFGVNSPSRETAWIGRMLDEGLAVGIAKNANKPLGAMEDVVGDMLDQETAFNGINLDRSLQTTFKAEGPEQSVGLDIMSKLDSILAAIKDGKVIALDKKTLVGETLSTYDNELGKRRALAARGAL